MNKQPEALRLADELERWLLVDAPTRVGAATELRRLHAVNQELLEALRDVENRTVEGGRVNNIACAAIAKATGGEE